MTTATVDSGLRLLASWYRTGRADLGAHLETHGETPLGSDRSWAAAVLDAIDASGLTGRGGGGFPTGRKLASLAGAGPRPLIAVNAMEGEPAGHKDEVLLRCAPHLVLDGLEVLAALLGAREAVVCVSAEKPATAAAVEAARRERGLDGNRTGAAWSVSVALLSGGYVAGEESAVVDALAGGQGRPSFRPAKGVPLRLGRQPVLVQNAETLAHVALIARHGAAWFRAVGTERSPGTSLVAVSGAVTHPGVHEVALGVPVREILARAGCDSPPAGVLVGGYGGACLGPDELETGYASEQLGGVGVPTGAGILVALARDTCGIAETARLAAYMAGQSAGQCGPCVFGLSDIASDLAALASDGSTSAVAARLQRRLGTVEGRGACRHPDGVVRVIRSALRVFAAEAERHRLGQRCGRRHDRSDLTLPAVRHAVIGRSA